MIQEQQQDEKLSETSNNNNESKTHDITLNNDKTLLLDISEDLFVENTKVKQSIELFARQSIEESIDESIVDNVSETPDQRLNRKFVSKNVFNLSHYVLTGHEISVLDKD